MRLCRSIGRPLVGLLAAVLTGSGLPMAAHGEACCGSLEHTKIAFTSGRDGNAEVYVINADGSDPINLTNHPATDGEPDWSPDGRQIVFTSDRSAEKGRADAEEGSEGDIYVMNADGSGVRRLTGHIARDFMPAWSSDGTRIAFTSTRDGNMEVYAMDADGANVVNLTNSPEDDGLPAWSPDGKQVAFTSVRADIWGVYVMDADGANQTRLMPDSPADAEPVWSPDGRLLAFTSKREPGGIYILDMTSGHVRRVMTDGGMNGFPDWSPDGQRLTWIRKHDDNPEVYVMDADGSDPTRLTDHPDMDTEAAWSPFLPNGE